MSRGSAQLALVLTLVSCDDDGTSAIDAGPDLQRPADGPVVDRGPARDLPGAADLAVDGSPVDAAVADVVAGDGAPPDPGPVQCREDSDCGGGDLTCNREAPGGICLGCGTSCPGLLVCHVGACVRACQGDEDCNAGFRCSFNLQCLLRQCDAQTPCPPPYRCGDQGRCRRPPCGPGGTCPAPLVCTDRLCLEP